MTRLREAAEDGDGGVEFDLVSAFRKGEGRHLLRWALAQQLEGLERITAGFAGPDGESALVEGRNARAMEVFDEQVEDGIRYLGIYYGAAHMPDFEKRLKARGYKRIGQKWLTAWDLTKRKDPDRYISTRRKSGKKQN